MGLTSSRGWIFFYFNNRRIPAKYFFVNGSFFLSNGNGCKKCAVILNILIFNLSARPCLAFARKKFLNGPFATEPNAITEPFKIHFPSCFIFQTISGSFMSGKTLSLRQNCHFFLACAAATIRLVSKTSRRIAVRFAD